MTLTVGSLFSGIGGIDLGLERAGMNVLWQVEKDPYARRVLAKRWPKVVCYEDVRLVHGYGNCADPEFCWRHLPLAPVDLVCGGFPCQDISVAGKGKGIKEGTRSGLWIEFARIVRELRPRYVLVENVSALRSRGLNRVLGDLATLGYDAEWESLCASEFGAPQRRQRLFIVAYPSLPRVEGLESGTSTSVFGSRRRGGEAFSPPWPGGWVASTRGNSRAEPALRGMDDGYSAGLDRLRCLGNAVVPQVAEYLGLLILNRAYAERSP